MFRPYILFILAQRSVLLLASKFILDISEEFTDRKFLCVRLFMYCVLLSNLFEIGKFIQGINSSQTQQFITHNSLIATSFDLITYSFWHSALCSYLLVNCFLISAKNSPIEHFSA